MTRDGFVDILMKRLGNSNDASLRDDIIAEMVHVQDAILEGDVFFPWFLLSEMATSETILSDERVPLPDDYIAPWEEGFLYRYDVELDDPYIEMKREDWSEIKQVLNYAGTPTHYDLTVDYILMRPVADAVYPLRMRYMAKGTDLAGSYGDAANVENVWLKHASDWFLGAVGEIISSQYLQRKEAITALFTKQAARGRARVLLKNVAMQEILKERIIGG